MWLTNKKSLVTTKTDIIWIKFLFAALFLFGLTIDLAEGFISCSPSPCKNAGICVAKLKGESYCNCTSKYVGEFCQHPNPCHTGAGPRCQNGGICEVVTYRDGTPQFSCRCPIGYTASLCEIREDNACNSSPCNNGGVCVLKSLKEYTCRCAQGYSGPHCDKQNLCASSPCRNGGTCTSNSGGSFKCNCTNGFEGPTCAEDIEECTKNPCRHGGTCVNTHGSYQCICPPGMTGKNCESKYAPCKPSPCQNGGTCRSTSPITYECKCPPGM